MRLLWFLALALGALAPRAFAIGVEPVRYRCDEAIVDAGLPFRRTAVLVELTQTTFYDNEGNAFWFGTPGLDGRLKLSLRHSRYGYVSDVDGGANRVERRFAGFRLEADGSIDGTDAHVDFGLRQDEGFLTALFTYFRDRLPVGATLKLLDISATRFVGNQASALTDERIEAIASAGAGARLYQMYRRLRAVAGPPETLAPGWDPATARGFANYLADIGSVWGRVARHGNFRRNYRSAFRDAYFPLFRKLPIPDALRAEENELLASVNLPFFLALVLPPLSALPFATVRH